ncbi:MAG: hypothetical protein E7328_05825 [Clostridiales bacterium]|nr:hypothetical protein [Clostridiales bacterium]
MKKFKRTLSLLLCLIMVACLVPTTVFAEGSEPEKYDVWVAGTQVTSANAGNILGDGAASYDAATNTLTVSKNITAPGYCIQVKTTEEFTLDIDGDVTISSKGNYAIFNEGSDKLTVTGDNLTIDSHFGIHSGKGSVDMTANEVVIKSAGNAIYAFKDITIDCDTLDIVGEECVYSAASSIDMTVDEVTIEAENRAIYAYAGVTIDCGTLDINGKYGIYVNDGSLDLTADEVDIEADLAIRTNRHNVTIDCNKFNSAGDGGVYAYLGSIIIENGTFDIRSTYTGENEENSYAIFYDNDFTYPSGSVVTAATEVDGTFEAYNESKKHSYDHVKIGTPTPATYTVTFNSDGGSEVAPQTIEEGGKVTKPADPTKEGFDFIGWTIQDKEWNFDNEVTGDMTLVAVWKEKEVTPPGGDDTTDPEDPTKPEGTTKPENNPSDVPQTGDNSMIWLWIALLFVSGAGVVATTVYGKKRFSVK